MKNCYYPRIKDLREDRDMSQRDLAKLLDMKQPQYFRYEQGYRDLPTDVLIRLSEIFNVSTDYILGLTNNPQKPKNIEK
ncbi:MAG: helix-turn-helix transcriptional regulator [Clostridia bacterium]|nr:helix-turn-helix transcriptional regulator [Clostridia bacterium]